MSNENFNQQANQETQKNQEILYSQLSPGSQPQINQTPYLVCAILVTILCCIPLGIPAIVYASKIDSMQNAGDYEGAAKNAKNAKLFTIIAAVIGAVFVIGYSVLVMLGMAASLGNYNYY